MSDKKQKLHRRNSLVSLRGNLRKKQEKREWETGERKKENCRRDKDLSPNSTLLKQNEYPFYRHIFPSPSRSNFTFACLGFYRLSFPCISASAIGTDRQKRAEFISITLGKNDRVDESFCQPKTVNRLLFAQPPLYFNYTNLYATWSFSLFK